MSVTVRAGKSSINLKFMDITAEHVSPVALQIIISFIRCVNQSRLIFMLFFYSLCRKNIDYSVCHCEFTTVNVAILIFSDTYEVASLITFARKDTTKPAEYEETFTIDFKQEQVFDLNND